MQKLSYLFSWMNTYRARRLVGISIAAYFVSFVASILLIMFFGLPTIEAALQAFNPSVWVASFATAALIGYGAAKWYLRDPVIVVNAREGFLCGLVIVGLGVFFDLCMVALYSIATGSAELFVYYSKPFFSFVVLIVLAATSIAGLTEETMRRSQV